MECNKKYFAIINVIDSGINVDKNLVYVYLHRLKI